jgi:hypothetical protein
MTKALMEAAKLYDDPRFLSKSELRIIANKKRRLRIVRRQKMMIILALTILVLIAVFWKSTLRLSAQEDTFVPECKYYKVITVHSNDTIWNIANDYFSEENYSGLDSYIAEICRINRLKDADTLIAGENLIVPYYASFSDK